MTFLSSPTPRKIDEKPMEATTEKNPLPMGEVQVSFALNTGGDQMGFQPMQTGLEYFVHYGYTFVHQQIASCNAASIADGGTENEVVTCDDASYQFSKNNDQIVISKVEHGIKQIIATVPLPVATHTMIRGIAPLAEDFLTK